jgi:hypothetical protein
MTHALDGCRAKLARAKELVEELHGSLVQFLESRPYTTEGALESDTSDWVVRFRVGESPPFRFGVVAGDVVHNLRSTLDHLAWQLVVANGAEPTNRTQFPIYGDEAAFRSARAQEVVAGMSDGDRAAIEELQPFHQDPVQEKPHPLTVLHELSNVDKHRVVHTTLVETAGSQFKIYDLEDISAIGEMKTRFGVLEDGEELVRVRVFPDGPVPRLKVDAQLALDVVFADTASAVHAESVLGVLLELGEYVDNVIDRFTSRFGGDG